MCRILSYINKTWIQLESGLRDSKKKQNPSDKTYFEVGFEERES